MRELSIGIAIAPGHLVRAQVDREHVGAVGPDVRAIAFDCARRAHVRADWQREQRLAVGRPDGAELLVAAADVDDAVVNGRRGVYGAVGLQLPADSARFLFERVQVCVVRPDEHQIVHHDRRRPDLVVGLEGPELLPVADVDGVQDAGQIANEDRVGGDGGRRFADEPGVARGVLPPQRPGVEIDREQLAFGRSDVDRPVGDGGRRLDRFAGFVGPFELQRIGRCGGCDAGETGVAAELGPIGRCLGREMSPHAKGHRDGRYAEMQP